MKKNFRFFDNRQKYLLFVTTTNEKNVIADNIYPHIKKIKPKNPGLKIFDAGMGDGSLLMNVMRQCHQEHPQIPLLISTKEIFPYVGISCLGIVSYLGVFHSIVVRFHNIYTNIDPI